VLLLHEKTDVNQATTDDGITPLYAASHFGHVESVGELLKHQLINPNKAMADNDGDTPLIAAARKGHVQVAELLLAHTAIDPNQGRGGGTGATPLYEAAQKGHAGVVRRSSAEE
jgi:ankyrin repeat protein